MIEISNNEKKIIKLCDEIEKLSELNLNKKESIFISYYLKRRDFKRIRVYMESCVMSTENNILNQAMRKGKVTQSFIDRYKNIKEIDNKITYICQELT